MNDWKPAQEAGAALILRVIEAARAVVSKPGYGLATLYDQDGAALGTAVAMLGAAMEQLAPRPAWRVVTWKDIAGSAASGTRVRLGTAEAVVESAALQTWHADPRSSEFRPQPLEHQVCAVRLAGRGQLYSMPPTGAVEILDVEWPEADMAGWVSAAGAVLECQAMENLKRSLGAEEVEQ
jgi:hypothetical protein